MTSIFVYEYLTGGGLFAGNAGGKTPDSLLAEGQAMVAALAADFAASSSAMHVACLRSRRFAGCHATGCQAVEISSDADHDRAFDRLAAEADWTIVIAPEIGGALAERCRRVAEVGGRLLGPTQPLIELASDKHATAEFLASGGVPVPEGVAFQAGAPRPRGVHFPAVWKPLDGAGSQGIVYLPDAEAPLPLSAQIAGRLERLYPGLPASVAMLCGPGGKQFSLPPCRQRLSEDGGFHYLGGELPLPPALDERARRLAERAASMLPGACGYLGIDLVLGEPADGSGDVVIEINPRLTTSYIGLRAACGQNLADAMLQIAQGDSPRDAFIAQKPIRFDADGKLVEMLAAPQQDLQVVASNS